MNTKLLSGVALAAAVWISVPVLADPQGDRGSSAACGSANCPAATAGHRMHTMQHDGMHGGMHGQMHAAQGRGHGHGHGHGHGGPAAHDGQRAPAGCPMHTASNPA